MVKFDCIVATHHRGHGCYTFGGEDECACLGACEKQTRFIVRIIVESEVVSAVVVDHSGARDGGVGDHWSA